MDIDGYIGFDEMEIDWESWTISKKYPDSKNTAKKVQEFLNSLTPLKNKNLIININNCPGGDVGDALMMFEKIKSVGLKSVTTNIAGLTASAATIVAQCGDKRRQSENSLMLIHLSQSCEYGNVKSFQKISESLSKIDDRIANIYTGEGKKTKEEYLELMSKNEGEGIWLTPDEALQYNLIDEIYKPENKYKVSNSILNNNIKTFKLPEIPENLKNIIMDNNTEDKEKKVGNFITVWWNKFQTKKNEGKPENVKPLETIEDFEAQIAEIENKANTEVQNLTSELKIANEKLVEFETIKNSLVEKSTAVENLTAEKTTLTNKITEKDTNITNLTNALNLATKNIERAKVGAVLLNSLDDSDPTKVVKVKTKWELFDESLSKS